MTNDACPDKLKESDALMNHKQRILTTIRGGMSEVIPYAPRIDLWYNANSLAGTIPEKHKGRTQDEISRAEGWALHKVIPEYGRIRRQEDTLHGVLGIFNLTETVYTYRFPSDVEVNVKHEGDYTHVEYHTPIGMVRSTTVNSEEMKKAGASSLWIEEYVIKEPGDYKVLGYIFENLKLLPDFDDFIKWQNEIGEDGLPVAFGQRAASPMHHIQKHFLDATSFFYHYRDYSKEMTALAESLEPFFDQALEIVSDSPAEAVLWGINFDDMITYPDYFKKDIFPWIRKASEVFSKKGKVLFCHCDGENLGLMDLIKDSGLHVVEGICPYPMTKVKIEEYYRRWSDKLTIFGGVPSTMLLEESATEAEFEAYLDHLFKAVAPGKRLILGLGDTAPPNAVFDRIVRIGDRVEKEGRLPLEGGAARPLSENHLAKVKARVMPEVYEDDLFRIVREKVLNGEHIEIKRHALELLDKGVNAHDILKFGMISAMEIIGSKFKAGKVFIPEVLLSARAMNEALLVLEPYLASDNKSASGKILIGTVWGDMHDIGKNMVITMLRGVGLEVLDMGINVPTQKIVEQVSEYKPAILGLSALLTTTMPEMKKVIDALKDKGSRNSVRVMVGGAPVNEKFAKDIGADGYAPDAGEAVDLVRRLLVM
ncbi:MAG: cobalamin-dependent protein [Thermodesulfobacteriota bacterium]